MGSSVKTTNSARGRKRAEEHLPHLLEYIQAVVDSQSQTAPSFQSTRLYTRLTAAQVRHQLIEQKGYSQTELPTKETIRLKLNQLGYHPSRVAKSKPPKKIPETEAIFEQIAQVNTEADADPTILRISMDAKATVKIGPFEREGKTRVSTTSSEHDFQAQATLTPKGILLPDFDELFLYLSESKVTSDFIVDILEDCWQQLSQRFRGIHTFVLNQDNGPKNNSHRTQFMKRIVQFAQNHQLNVRLAYYPPYHSKYNPIERT